MLFFCVDYFTFSCFSTRFLFIGILFKMIDGFYFDSPSSENFGVEEDEILSYSFITFYGFKLFLICPWF